MLRMDWGSDPRQSRGIHTHVCQPWRLTWAVCGSPYPTGAAKRRAGCQPAGDAGSQYKAPPLSLPRSHSSGTRAALPSPFLRTRTDSQTHRGRNAPQSSEQTATPPAPVSSPPYGHL
ncbi:unnamed protein product [Lota lota]